MIGRIRVKSRGGAPALLLGLVLLLCARPAGAQRAPEELAQWIDQAVAENSACVGLAVGVKQDRKVAARYFGTTGNQGVPTADTEFEIGSITKTFTATLLAWADQQGRARIDDPLAKFAPSRVPNWQGQPILLLHLADHTSGLPRQMPRLPPRLLPEDVWAFLARYQLTRAPGAEFLYSNIGVNVLGLALERVHGVSLDQLYAGVITGQLGMPDTAMELSPARHARLAWGYGPNGQRATEFTPGFPFVGGASALRSTLRDMMRYLEFELGEVRSPLASLLPVLHQVRHAVGPSAGVGLGWHIQLLPDGTPIISKDGAMPGYSSFIIFAPFSQTGAVVLSNQARCGVQKIGTSLMRRLNGLQTQPAEPMAPTQEDEP